MKLLKKIWELMGDEKFTLPFIAVVVTLMTILNLSLLALPAKWQVAMIALNVGLVACTIAWHFVGDDDDKR